MTNPIPEFKPDPQPDPWVDKMQAAGWHPIRDLFDSIVQWRFGTPDNYSYMSRADAEQYRRLNRTPPPF